MGDLNLAELLPKVIGVYVPFLFALCFHEYAHGWVAKKKGDNTAEMMGRLTMNPVAHADIVGTVFLPIMGLMSGWAMFGWAKPVPVNPTNLKNPKDDMFWIALAGPASNLLLAILGSIALVTMDKMTFSPEAMATAKTVADGLFIFIFINILLCFFNLIPLHPLDGGKILARFLPHEANRWLEDNSMTLNIILIGAFILGGFTYLAQFAHGVMRLIFSFLT